MNYYSKVVQVTFDRAVSTDVIDAFPRATLLGTVVHVFSNDANAQAGIKVYLCWNGRKAVEVPWTHSNHAQVGPIDLPHVPRHKGVWTLLVECGLVYGADVLILIGGQQLPGPT